jgi:hypothetical protein
MKRMTSIVFCAVAGMLTAGTGLAQSYSVQANVPFNFAVGRAWLPAGTYTINQETPGTITLDDSRRHQVAMTFVQPGDTSKDARGELVFHRYGDRYFLSEVLCPAAGMSAVLPTSRLERKAQTMEQARNGDPGLVLLALNR